MTVCINLQVDEHFVEVELLCQHCEPHPLTVGAPAVTVAEQRQTRGQISCAREGVPWELINSGHAHPVARRVREETSNHTPAGPRLIVITDDDTVSDRPGELLKLLPLHRHFAPGHHRQARCAAIRRAQATCL